MFVLHQRINKIFWSPIIDPIVLVKIGKWKPYYFFVCAIVPGERRTNIFCWPKNTHDATYRARKVSGFRLDQTVCYLHHHRHRIFWTDNLRTETNTFHPIIAILESLLLRWVENNNSLLVHWPHPSHVTLYDDPLRIMS